MRTSEDITLNKSQFVKYVRMTCLALLVVIEIVVCAQFATVVGISSRVWLLVAVIACCFVLTVLEFVHAFFVALFPLEMVFYGMESALLLAISAITGNSFLSTLYCIVLTQFYLSVAKFKDRTILFGTACGFYIVSFIVGWVTVNEGASVFSSIVDILGGCIFGLFVLGVHYVVANFLIKFYVTNVELRAALDEAEQNREKLREVYEQLSKTAVYEERNRIAKEIHDNAGHSMTTVIMQTEAAKLLIDTDPAEAKNRIISANLQARDALERMRESVHLLAGRGTGNSLKADIEEIIAQTIDGTDLKIRCDLEDVELSEDAHRFVCDTIKESFSNGIRHGRATAFYVEVKKSLGNLQVIISDNGFGTVKIKEGFGLSGIRKKAAELGGSCVFGSEDGEGFETQITLPLKNQENGVAVKEKDDD